MAFMRKLWDDQAGTSAVEYGLICSLMVVGLVVGVQGLGATVGSSFDNTKSKIQTATQP
ncbi:MAG: Flp family type IVb pilin [Novosphingobium sp.]|uniref:Flp family type IVb pilin n=1 Tax=Novosphingobium sp. TaxID=1874826 RepID=UPI0032BC3371